MENQKLYDLAMVEMIGGGDPAFTKKMVQLFVDTMPKNFDDINNALQTQDWVSVGKLAHKLKATIDSMSIVSLQQDIRTLEANGKNAKDVEVIPTLADKIVTVLKQCVESMKKDFGV
jgi:HPt (histidine-containing phosphotransfer) domain-containing protein